MLDTCHRAFLLSQDTLVRWAGHTVNERVSLFQAKFPDKRISASALRRLYLRHGVRRKEIKVQKLLPASTVQNFDTQRDAVLRKMTEARDTNLPILYLDEIAFTKRSLLSRTWSSRGMHVSVDQS